MDDRLDLAHAVGVLDPNTQYLRQLERVHRHQERMDYLKGGTVFGAVFAFYCLLVLHIGAA